MSSLALPASAAVGPTAFVLWVALIMTTACGIAALAGFGGNLLALPFVAWVCGDLWPAVVLVLLIGTLQSLAMAAANVRAVRWRSLGALVAWSAAGLPLGLALTHWLPQRPLMLLMGLVILVGAVAGHLQVAQAGEERRFGLGARLLLLAAGIMHGAFGCGGPTVVLAARGTLREKDAFRATMFAFWVFLNAFALAGMYQRLTVPGLPLLVAVGLPCMALGSWLGQTMSRRVPQKRFGELVAAMLAVTGLVTMARAW
ncbi:MAG: sulfite exporter TauE/SafE family protein [Armatimonadetes bacterium]|nr:sulfite exporter TauE/SafE family protein [Armatimonadota bacterium]